MKIIIYLVLRAGTPILSLKGGFHPQRLYGDMADHHLAIAFLFLLVR